MCVGWHEEGILRHRGSVEDCHVGTIITEMPVEKASHILFFISIKSVCCRAIIWIEPLPSGSNIGQWPGLIIIIVVEFSTFTTMGILMFLLIRIVWFYQIHHRSLPRTGQTLHRHHVELKGSHNLPTFSSDEVWWRHMTLCPRWPVRSEIHLLFRHRNCRHGWHFGYWPCFSFGIYILRSPKDKNIRIDLISEYKHSIHNLEAKRKKEEISFRIFFTLGTRVKRHG